MKKRIVLLHGWGASTKKLEPLGRELEKLRWEVFVPKIPGFDTKPPKNTWGLVEYAEFIHEKIEKKWDKGEVVVFGHSFGGRIAIKLSTLGKNAVDGVVLCSTGGISRAGLVKRCIFWVLAKAGKILLISPAIARYWKKVLYKTAREHDYEKTTGVTKEIFKKVVGENLKSQIKKIDCPTLVIWGEQDKTTPVKDAYFIKYVLPSAKLKVFKEFGHRLPYENPEELALIVNKWHQSLK